MIDFENADVIGSGGLSIPMGSNPYYGSIGPVEVAGYARGQGPYPVIIKGLQSDLDYWQGQYTNLITNPPAELTPDQVSGRIVWAQAAIDDLRGRISDAISHSGGYGAGALAGTACDTAKQRLAQAGGDNTWLTRDCGAVQAEICSHSSLFVSTSAEDVSIRCGAGCPLANQSCSGQGVPPGTGSCPASCTNGCYAGTATCLPAQGGGDDLTQYLPYIAGALAIGAIAFIALGAPQSKTITIAKQ